MYCVTKLQSVCVSFHIVSYSSGSGLYISFFRYKSSLVAQLVKNPPAMQVTPVQFLGLEDPLEKG